MSSRDCRVGDNRMAIYIEPTPKITEFLKYSENSQSKHKKTTSGSGFEEILGKEQERFEKEKQL